MKLDILVFAAHPDDAELAVAGTILKHVKLGYKVGVIDLTQGELSTRGSVELRKQEADNASQILGLSVRENLKFADGFFLNDATHQLEIIKKIRQYQPDIILCNAIYDRHPDHGRAGQLVVEAAFYAGLAKIESILDGKQQSPWRPKVVYRYIQFYSIQPDFVVDISEEIDQKMEAIKAYQSQFYDPNSNEPETVIARKEYLDAVKSRDMDHGKSIGTVYAEGFTKERLIGVNNLMNLI